MRALGWRGERRRTAALVVVLGALFSGCSPAGQGVAPGKDAAGPTGVLERGPYDLVLAGGRVMDPESGTDAVLNVGIRQGLIVALTADSLEATETVDVAGLVVAPGFIDLHAHGQDEVSARLKVPVEVARFIPLD